MTVSRETLITQYFPEREKEIRAYAELLQGAGIDYESADTSFLPTLSIPLDADGATKVFALIDAIEELDDVQNVYGNFDVSDEVMATL